MSDTSDTCGEKLLARVCTGSQVLVEIEIDRS